MGQTHTHRPQVTDHYMHTHSTETVYTCNSLKGDCILVDPLTAALQHEVVGRQGNPAVSGCGHLCTQHFVELTFDLMLPSCQKSLVSN